MVQRDNESVTLIVRKGGVGIFVFHVANPSRELFLHAPYGFLAKNKRCHKPPPHIGTTNKNDPNVDILSIIHVSPLHQVWDAISLFKICFTANGS